MSALSRWKVILDRGTGEWVVVNEERQEAPERARFMAHGAAQERADLLNRAEVYERFGARA